MDVEESKEITDLIAKTMQSSVDWAEKRNPIERQKKYDELCMGENAHHTSLGQKKVFEIFKDKYGVVMDVEKEVTDSMDSYSLDDSCFSDVKWVSPSIQFSFEDKSIKSIELQKGDTLKFLFSSMNFDDFDSVNHAPKTQEAFEIKKFFDLLDNDSLLQTGGEMVMYKVHLTEELGGGYVIGYIPATASYKKFAEISFSQSNTSDFNNIDKEQTEYKLNAIMTAFKVMAFASIPKLAPTPVPKKDSKTRRKISKRVGRKLDNGQVFRVVHLPKIIKHYTEKQKSNGKGNSLENGRVGHLVYYKHERYVNKQFTWDLRVPIADKFGNLPKVAYKVRIPKIETESVENHQEACRLLEEII